MTLDQFIKKYNGKYLDVDNAYGNQCVDLIKAYLVEVLNIPAISRGNAIDYWTNYPEELHQESKPEVGDIVIWDKGIGSSVGHIAIVNEVAKDSLVVFEQNNPLGTPCHLARHTYKHIIGYLRTNVINMEYSELITKLSSDGFVKKDERFTFYPNGKSAIVDNNKQYFPFNVDNKTKEEYPDIAKAIEDMAIVYMKLARPIREVEKKYPETKDRREVL